MPYLMEFRFLPPYRWVYTFQDKTKQILLYVLASVLTVSFAVYVFGHTNVILAFLSTLLVGFQIYQGLGIWFGYAAWSQSAKNGSQVGVSKSPNQVPAKFDWPTMLEHNMRNEKREKRDKARLAVMNEGFRYQFRREKTLMLAVPVILFHVYLGFKGDLNLLLFASLLALTGFQCYLYGFQQEQQRHLGLLKKLEKDFADVDDLDEHIVRKVMPVEGIPIYPQSNVGSHGTAKWLSEYEKNKLNQWGEGLWLGGGFFHNGEGNLLTVAEPGSGKGASVILPNLLFKRDKPYSFVVLDPKGTNACISAAFQKSIGQQVIILDPRNIQEEIDAKHGIPQSCFNPLDWISQKDLISECSNIISALTPDDPKAERYWNGQAVDLLSGVLMHIMTFPKYEGERHLGKLYDLVRKNTWAEIFVEMAQNEACDGEILVCSFKFSQIAKSSDKTFGSIVAVSQQALDWLKDANLKKSILKSDFDPREISKGGLTIYLSIPFENAANYSAWGRIVIGTLMKLNRSPKSYRRANCYYLIDEFPSLRQLQDIENYLATGREYNIRIWLFVQNMSQLDLIYGQSMREVMIGTCKILQAFATRDLTTAKLMSDRLGVSTEVFFTLSDNFSRTYGSSTQKNETGTNESRSYGTSISENRHSRPLMYLDEVIGENSMITCTDHGNMKLARWQYWMTDKNYNTDTLLQLGRIYQSQISVNAEENPNFRMDVREEIHGVSS